MSVVFSTLRRRVLVGSAGFLVSLLACSSNRSPGFGGVASNEAGLEALPPGRDATTPDATPPDGTAPDVRAHPPDAVSSSPDAALPETGLRDAPRLEAMPTEAAGPVDAPIVGCGDAASDTVYTCTGDGNARVECASGVRVDQPCPNGCLREPAGEDAICMGTTATNWSCTGDYGTVPVDDGNYYLTEFGCWVDDAGTHTDPDDNCIPACLAQAQAAGLCDPNGSGPDCEEKLSWYTADGARFGCLQRLRVTNPANGKSVIAIALDYGPGCSGENDVQHAALDASGLVNDYLFGGAEGRDDRAVVHVVEVDDSMPLGPVP